MRGKRTQTDHERYMTLLEQDKKRLEDEIAAAQEQKALSENKINNLIGMMENPAKIWQGVSLEARQLLQQMIFFSRHQGQSKHRGVWKSWNAQFKPTLLLFITKKWLKWAIFVSSGARYETWTHMEFSIRL